MRRNIFKYIFIIGFIIFLIVVYAVFYNKEEIVENVDQMSTKTTIITNIRLGIAGFDSLNPIVSSNRDIKDISKLIFDSLVTIDEKYNLKCVLASEIAKTDNLTYIIKLRNNVYWHDGTLFTANDVVFTMNKIRFSEGFVSTYRSNLDYVDSVEAIDANTVRIVLNKEVDFFEYKLTFPILSEAYYLNEDFVNTIKNDTVIGTGKFYIAEAANNKLKLVKNLNYWDKELLKDMLLEEVEITIYNTIGEVYTDFKSGYLDAINVKASNIEDYIGSLGYKKIEYYTRDVNFLAFNTTKNEMLADNRVRRAINYMLDRNNIISNIGSGFAVSQFVLPQSHWLYDSKLEIDYNAEQAKQLLEEAGYVYTNNTWVRKNQILALNITVNSDRPDRVQVVNNLVAQLNNHGIVVNVNAVPTATYQNLLNNKNYDVILCGFEIEFSPKLSTLFKTGNIANYSNSKMDEILNNVKNHIDNQTMKEQYSKLYDLYLEDMPYIFLYRETDYMIYNQTLSGNLIPNAFSIFHNIDKWYRK